jgi:hypothetical protein
LSVEQAASKWTYSESTIKAVKVNNSSYSDDSDKLDGLHASSFVRNDQNASISGTLSHEGLVMTSGTGIDQVYTVTKLLQVTTSWQDILRTYLPDENLTNCSPTCDFGTRTVTIKKRG